MLGFSTADPTQFHIVSCEAITHFPNVKRKRTYGSDKK